jgi:hypothetical protein
MRKHCGGEIAIRLVVSMGVKPAELQGKSIAVGHNDTSCPDSTHESLEVEFITCKRNLRSSSASTLN